MGVFEEIGDFLGIGKKEETVTEPVEPEKLEMELDSESEPESSSEPESIEPAESIELVESAEPEPKPKSEPEPKPEPEPESEPEPEDELTLTKKQNEALLARLDELEGKPSVVVKPESEPEADKLKDVSFIGDDDDIDSYLNDKTKLNELLVKVYHKALDDAGTQFSGNIPNVVIEQIQKHMTLRDGIDEFFTANKDLLPVRKTVGAITNEVVSEHGDWTLKQVLTEAEKRTRETLGIKRKVEVKRERNPALVEKGSSRQKTKDLRSDVQKDIDDLLT